MDWTERTDNGRCFTGSDVQVYRAIVIANGLKFYVETGMKVNRAYTPKNMMRAAAEITGQTFRPRDYAGAYRALMAWAEAAKAAPRVESN